MYKYFCLNPISPVGLEKFSDDYVLADEMERQVEVQYLLDEENEPEEDTAPSEEAEPEAAV